MYRSADVTADSYVVCYTLRRQAFNKLLGPIEQVRGPFANRVGPDGMTIILVDTQLIANAEAHTADLMHNVTESLMWNFYLWLILAAILPKVWRLEALRKVPILFNLPEPQLQELASRMHTTTVAAEQVIFHVGDPGMHLHLSDSWFTH